MILSMAQNHTNVCSYGSLGNFSFLNYTHWHITDNKAISNSISVDDSKISNGHDSGHHGMIR